MKGGATQVIAFAREPKIKVAFIDSAPCDVTGTLLFNAQQILGTTLAPMSMAALKSAADMMAPELGPPDFKYDPQQMLNNVNLSGNRKIFFLHVNNDLVVPTSNYYVCTQSKCSKFPKET